jgi:hypothetical protein
MSLAGPVRGRQGPHKHRENEYARKSACECEDRRGNPAPVPDLATGDCVRCGHPVKEQK